MPQQFSRGGEMRTIGCGCGWSCRKSIREANAAHQRHLRFCEIKRSPEEMRENIAQVTKKGDKVQQEVNGWMGVQSKNLNCAQKRKTVLKTWDDATGIMTNYNVVAPVRFHNADALNQRRVVELTVNAGLFDAFNNAEIGEDETDALLMVAQLL